MAELAADWADGDVDPARDEALVRAAQAGRADAFAELYQLYYRRLVRVAAKRTGDQHEAEDVVQEAFARAYRILPDFAGDRRFYPWVSVIVDRLCVDAWRRRSRVRLTQEFELPAPEGPTPDPDHHLVREAMRRLTPRHHDTLWLREHHGWSYQRIADHYGVSVGAIEQVLWRARRALRRECEAGGLRRSA